MRTIPDLAAEMRALLSVVAEEDVGYALCGGLAGNTYGADQLTVDIDLVISPEDLGAALSLARTADVYESRYAAPQEDLRLWLVAVDELIKRKRGSDRPIDHHDIERLT